MVASVAAGPNDLLLQALEATKIAIRHYADACRALQAQRHASLDGRHLDLNVRRLDAMETDLRRRVRPGHTPDAHYASLTVLHAGLLSLAEASGRVCDSYRRTLAIPPPVEGWFAEETASADAFPSAPADAVEQPEP